MKIISVILLAVLLMGCDAMVTSREVEWANFYCEDKGGVRLYNTITSSVHCIKGGQVKYTNAAEQILNYRAKELLDATKQKKG